MNAHDDPNQPDPHGHPRAGEAHAADPAHAQEAADLFVGAMFLSNDADADLLEDRPDVAHRLTCDDGFRTDAQALADMDQLLRESAQRPDAMPAIPAATSDRALRASLSLVREHALRRQGSRQDRQGLMGAPRWAWGTAAAAAVAIGSVVWFVSSDPMYVATDIPAPVSHDETIVADWVNPFSSVEAATSDEARTGAFAEGQNIQEQVDALQRIASMSDED